MYNVKCTRKGWDVKGRKEYAGETNPITITIVNLLISQFDMKRFAVDFLSRYNFRMCRKNLLQIAEQAAEGFVVLKSIDRSEKKSLVT